MSLIDYLHDTHKLDIISNELIIISSYLELLMIIEILITIIKVILMNIHESFGNLLAFGVD